nr:glycerol-3-phosphate acyltransferase 4-like [Danaus plexippus plexippus]
MNSAERGRPRDTLDIKPLCEKLSVCLFTLSRGKSSCRDPPRVTGSPNAMLVVQIGQRHDGFLGILQRALARASPHIWFERSEVKDRHAVARRLKEHISVPDNPPILIFPEGTCINNTSVMQFKKGSFEVGGTIYPVAIKYDPRFGDAFWNSSRYGMLHYLLNMMSSWAIVCDVWYLPPMTRAENETAVDFANRVKGAIARRGGLVDLMWDGQLKRMKAKKEWRELQQEEFSRRLKGE